MWILASRMQQPRIDLGWEAVSAYFRERHELDLSHSGRICLLPSWRVNRDLADPSGMKEMWIKVMWCDVRSCWWSWWLCNLLWFDYRRRRYVSAFMICRKSLWGSPERQEEEDRVRSPKPLTDGKTSGEKSNDDDRMSKRRMQNFKSQIWSHGTPECEQNSKCRKEDVNTSSSPENDPPQEWWLIGKCIKSWDFSERISLQSMFGLMFVPYVNSNEYKTCSNKEQTSAAWDKMFFPSGIGIPWTALQMLLL